MAFLQVCPEKSPDIHCARLYCYHLQVIKKINISLQDVDLDGYALSNHVVIFLHLDVNLKEKGRNDYSFNRGGIGHNFWLLLKITILWLMSKTLSKMIKMEQSWEK